MALEVELKFRLHDVAAFLKTLEAAGGVEDGAEDQRDWYFNAPNRDFAVTDEAVRLRLEQNRAWLTYKGPRIDASSKTRLELEAPFAAADAETMKAILERLGFRLVREVRKRRELHRLLSVAPPVLAAIDRVEGLPLFVELEIIAEEADLTTARESLWTIANRLGLHESERRSYLELLLEADRK